MDICRLIAGLLLGAGYHVEAAKDGTVALAALQRAGFDLLINDNGLPTLTGLGLLKRIHAARLDLPIIVASGTLPVWGLFRFPVAPEIPGHAAQSLCHLGVVGEGEGCPAHHQRFSG